MFMKKRRHAAFMRGEACLEAPPSPPQSDSEKDFEDSSSGGEDPIKSPEESGALLAKVIHFKIKDLKGQILITSMTVT